MSRFSHLVGLTPASVGNEVPLTGGTDKERYRLQKLNAAARGIKFKLTFDEWLTWWKETGHYHERGREHDQYVMSRFGDKGAYELGNIECAQAQDNSLAAHLGKKRSDATRANMSKAATKVHRRRAEEYLRRKKPA